MSQKKASVDVLFSDFNGIWCPMSDLYWSDQSSTLVSRHPISSVEEVISLYCPQCLTRYSEEQSIIVSGRCGSCKECPICASIITPDARNCEFCSWQEPLCNHQLQKTIVDQRELCFKALFDNLKEILRDKRGDVTHSAMDRGAKSDWHMEQLNNKLKHPTEFQDLRSIENIKLFESSCELIYTVATRTMTADLGSPAIPGAQWAGPALFPVGVALRSKRSLRGKQDNRSGRMNILVQPKTLPLEGDSSLKLQKGKWWVKDSSAIHELPSISVTALPDLQHLQLSGVCSVQLCITNPKMSPVRLSFSSETCNPPFQAYLTRFRTGSTAAVTAANSLTVSSNVAESSDQLNIEVGAYEDELLKDVDSGASDPPADHPDEANNNSSLLQAAEDASTALPLGQHGWTHRVVHNKAYITLPVQLAAECDPAAAFELNITCHVDQGSVGSGIKLPFKVVFAC